MPSGSPEVLAELLPLVAYAILGAALTAGGIAAEYASLQHLDGGQAMAGLWLAAIGCVMLYAGVYGIGYQKVLSRLVGVGQ